MEANPFDPFELVEFYSLGASQGFGGTREYSSFISREQGTSLLLKGTSKQWNFG